MSKIIGYPDIILPNVMMQCPKCLSIMHPHWFFVDPSGDFCVCPVCDDRHEVFSMTPMEDK